MMTSTAVLEIRERGPAGVPPFADPAAADRPQRGGAA